MPPAALGDYVVLGLLGGAPLSIPIGLVVGLLMGEWGCKNNRFNDEVAAITPVLAGSPGLSNIEFWMNSADGCATLSCVAKTREDRDRLLHQFVTLLGQARAEDRVRLISIEGE